MAEIKWIKIATDIFDDEKICLIESMPEADSVIVIWFKLLSFAGKSNNNGVFMLSNKIAYTDEMLSTIFRRPLNTVRMALKTFEQFGMIEHIYGIYSIPNWEKHQNVDGMEKIKEQNRLRVAKHREKQKLLTGNVTSNVTVTDGNAIDKDKEQDKEQDKDKEEEKNNKARLTAEFDTLWKLYPNKKGKDVALKAYIKARKNGVEYETIENGINNYATECQLKKTEKRFIKHGSTWFNQHGWDDEYDLTPPTEKPVYQPKPQASGNVFLDLLDNESGDFE